MGAKTATKTPPGYPSGYDPGLAPISGKSYKAGMGLITATEGALPSYLRPKTQAQLNADAGSYVHSQIDPQIAQIESGIDARSKAGTAAIGNYTKEWGDYLGGEGARVAAPWDEAISGTKDDMGALASFLGKKGGEDQAALTSKIASTFGNEDSSQQQQLATDATAGAAHGSAGNTLARGDAALTYLRGGKAADVGMAEQLPGVAMLGGQQSLRQLAEQLNAEQKDSTDKVRATVPGLLADIKQRLDDRNVKVSEDAVGHHENTASLLNQYLTSTQDRELQKAVGRQGFATGAADFGQKATQLDQSQQQIDAANTSQAEQTRHDKATESIDRSNASAPGSPKAKHDAFLNSEANVDKLFSGLVSKKAVPTVWLAPGADGKAHIVPPNTPGATQTTMPGASPQPVVPDWNTAINQGVALVSADLIAQGYTPAQIRQMVVAQAIALHIPQPPKAKPKAKNTSGMSNDPVHDAKR